jgi:hypothetical protein
MAQITQLSGTRESITGADTESLAREPIPFTSTCPRCTRAQHQRGFARAALRSLLDKGYPIEAYCVMCDQFWPIGPRERSMLGDALSRTDE